MMIRRHPHVSGSGTKVNETKRRAVAWEGHKQQKRGATLAQFATLWLLRRPEITTVLIGASKVAQIDDIHAGLKLAPLSADEQATVEKILKG